MKHVDVYVLDEFVGSYDIEGSGVEKRRLLAPPTRTVGDSGEVLLVWLEEKAAGWSR